jgi:subtilisin family serine protease
MRNKIMGIFVCMLMIAAVVLPVAGTLNQKENAKSILFNDDTNMEFAPGEFIVKLKKDTTLSSSTQFMALNEKHQVSAFEKMFKNAEGTILENIYLVYIPVESDILSIVREYESCPDVVYAEPNGVGTLCGIPNDANFSIQWALHNTGQVFFNWRGVNYSGIPNADIDAPEAWDIETGSPDVVIAILDSGIDYTHPDLAANIWNNTDEIPGNGIDDDHNGYIDDVRGWDFFYSNNDPKDYMGHGTMCAGYAGAVSNNGIGVAGICWDCSIMDVKVCDETGFFNINRTANGIKYAADNGANVISMSWAFTTLYKSLGDAVNYAYNKGVFLCAAAHNWNTSTKYYPAAFETVTAVGATNQNDERCTSKDWGKGAGSNFGDWVDIAAPGNLMYSTMPTYLVTMNDFGYKQNYDYMGGTSSATPLVAGVAALLLSQDPSLTPDEVGALLCGNVDPYISKEYIGTGRVNAQKALAALMSDIKVKIKGGLGIEAVITNEGTSDITGVAWQIHVEGGIQGLINKTVSGTVDIKAGESQTVSTGLFFGFGGIVISAKADIVGKAAKGTQLIIYSMVK